MKDTPLQTMEYSHDGNRFKASLFNDRITLELLNAWGKCGTGHSVNAPWPDQMISTILSQECVRLGLGYCLSIPDEWSQIIRAVEQEEKMSGSPGFHSPAPFPEDDIPKDVWKINERLGD